MKRSRSVSLVVLGSASLLSGCAKEEPAVAFASTTDCIESGYFSEEQCRAGYMSAQAEHQRVAPRYESRAVCENEGGNCEVQRTPTGQSWFIPIFAGYMLGRLHSPGAVAGTPATRYAYGTAQPLYRARGEQGALRTAHGYRVPAAGLTSVAARAVDPPASAATMRRGGFGSSARRGYGG